MPSTHFGRYAWASDSVEKKLIPQKMARWLARARQIRFPEIPFSFLARTTSGGGFRPMPIR